MARAKEPTVGSPSLSPDRAIVRLKQRIEDLAKFDPLQVADRWDAGVKALQASIDETLSNAFGHNSVDFKRYASAADLDDGPIFVNRSASPHEFQGYFSAGKDKAIKLLHQAVRSLEEKLEDAQPNHAFSSDADSERSAAKSRKVFVVHGRDDGPKEAVARFLEQLGFTPIILHEQANQGRTVIEKIEAHRDIGFAVVLLTPDDVGGLEGEQSQPRARQNVLLELGYFVGLLGRRNVCALQKGEVEIPSDWRGVLNEKFDEQGAWRMALARELQSAGHAVDWNRVMRT